MRFIPTILLAYVVLGLQSGLSTFIEINGVAPNLALPLVIFIALYAPRDVALVGVFIIGLMQDMLTQSPVGVYPLVYACVAFATRTTQPALQRGHWITHIIVACTGAIAQGAILYVVGLRMPPRHSWQVLMNMAIYSAVLTPILLRLLIWSKRLFIVPVTPRSGGFPASKD